MSTCLHTNIILISENSKRLRCRHCHLTIKAEELADGFCPECYDTDGQKRYDFEKLTTAENGAVRYRCEECGLWLEPRRVPENE